MFYLIQKMEDMDIDSVVDIPDTPDRLSVQQMNRGDCVEKEVRDGTSLFFRCQ